MTEFEIMVQNFIKLYKDEISELTSKGIIDKSGGEIITSDNFRIGYMLQDDCLFPKKTVLENAVLGLEIKRLLNDESRKKVINLLTKYGLGEFINSYPDSLSGGMKQRVALIRTLALDPDLLLLDDIGAETTTPWNRDEILGTILQYRMDNKKATFFTSNLNIKKLENHFITSNKDEEVIKARRIIERVKYLTDELELIGENKRK